MEKFLNKYRIPSARANWWDYSACGVYFITICTAQRLHYFGEVHDGNMILSEIGEIAESCWKQISDHFPFVKLDAFVVMPNHFHGILIIDPVVETPNSGVSGNSNPNPNQITNTETPKLGVSTRKQWKPGSLGVIINQYKRAVSISARKIHSDFSWQSRFHDKIIHHENEFYQIRFYIETNPVNWETDEFLN